MVKELGELGALSFHGACLKRGACGFVYLCHTITVQSRAKREQLITKNSLGWAGQRPCHRLEFIPVWGVDSYSAA